MGRSEDGNSCDSCSGIFVRSNRHSGVFFTALQAAPPKGNWVFWDNDNTEQGSAHTGPSINPNLCCSYRWLKPTAPERRAQLGSDIYSPPNGSVIYNHQAPRLRRVRHKHHPLTGNQNQNWSKVRKLVQTEPAGTDMLALDWTFLT